MGWLVLLVALVLFPSGVNLLFPDLAESLHILGVIRLCGVEYKGDGASVSNAILPLMLCDSMQSHKFVI